MSGIHHTFKPVPFADGHALTFTLREIYDPAGEFVSQYHDRSAAFHAFALARKHARYVELRNTDGRVIADYASSRRAQSYKHSRAEGGAA